uniref:Uncharacterized protein n=1 Tax=Romanomermis culicivorax TaxID=13658 RepID=A0A915KUI0_ROMCU
MPFCEKFYNSTSATVEVQDCLFDYYYVEIICAIVHLILAFLIIVGCLIFVTTFRRKFAKNSAGELPSRNMNYKRPLVTVEFNGIPKTGMQAAYCCSTEINSLDKLLHPLPGKDPVHRESGHMTNGLKGDSEDTFHRRKVNGTRQSVMVPNYKRTKNDGNAAKCRRNSLPNHARKNDATSVRSTTDFQKNRVITEKFAGQTVTVEFSPVNEDPSLPANIRTNQNLAVDRQRIYSSSNDTRLLNVQDYRTFQEQRQSTEITGSSYQSSCGRPTSSNRCSNSTMTEATGGDRGGHLFTFNPKNGAPVRQVPNAETDNGHAAMKSRDTMGISSIEELLNANMSAMQQGPDRFSYDSSNNSAAYKSNVDTTSRNSQSYGVHYGQNQRAYHHHHQQQRQTGPADDNCWPTPPPKMADYYLQSNNILSSSNLRPRNEDYSYNIDETNIPASSFPADKEYLSSPTIDAGLCGTRFSGMATKDMVFPILSVKDLVV